MASKIWLTVVVHCLMALAEDESDFWLSRSEEIAEEGKKQYEMIQEKAPRYGDCWKDAVEKLHLGCKRLTDEVQSRLALAFTDCFLKKAGRKGFSCAEDTPIEECLREIDDVMFASYTEFFTHTQSICFYLQSQVWQERTDDTIIRLTHSSEKVSHQLQSAKNNQEHILRLQEKSVDAQRQLLENGANLNQELELSRKGVREAFDEFRASTGEQRLLITEVFDRVSSLQALVLGEFTGLYSYFFYCLAVLVVYLLTSTPRTSAARFWLLGVWTVNVIVERALVSYLFEDDSVAKNGIFDTNSTLYHRVWACRKVSCVVAVGLLAFISARYRDYNVLNNRLLTDIHRQNEDLKAWLLSSGQCTLKSIEMNSSIPQMTITTQPDESDDSNYDSTYVCTSSSSDDDCDSDNVSEASWTSMGSRSATPVRDLLESVVPQRLRDAMSTFSPIKQSPPDVSVCNASMESTQRYNLRSRKSVCYSPNELKESPKTFQKVVRKLAHISRSNGRIVRTTLAQSKYSSDEE